MSYIVPQKMPLRCFECEYISPSTMDGYSCKTAHKSLVSEHGINIRRPDWCPLIEIKTPHGRLIDADALWDKMSHYTDNEGAKMPFGDNDSLIHIDSACFMVEEAPTVIEAEGTE